MIRTLIRTLTRVIDWRALLVPIGGAILTAGVTHLQARRDALESEIEHLGEVVAHRRTELSRLDADLADALPDGLDPWAHSTPAAPDIVHLPDVPDVPGVPEQSSGHE